MKFVMFELLDLFPPRWILVEPVLQTAGVLSFQIMLTPATRLALWATLCASTQVALEQTCCTSSTFIYRSTLCRERFFLSDQIWN